MLKNLFSSKAKIDVLKLFLFNPDNAYYQRQAAALIRHPVRGVQREVIKLLKLGLITKEDQGNRVYYRANKKCPIFNELKLIFFKCTGIATALNRTFTRSEDIRMAFVYGSYAEQNETLDSDIDLMVIGGISSRKLSGLLSTPKKDLGREINFSVFTIEEFREKIRQKDHFLSSIIKCKKIFIVGTGYDLKTLISTG